MNKIVITLAFAMNIAYANLGGISGGGGNVIAPTPPKDYQDPRLVRAIIKGSKELLCKFIRAKYALYNSGSMDDENQRMYSVLFSDTEFNLHEIMEDISLDVPLDRPCVDQSGTAFDGSTFNQKPNSVCISAQRISKNTTLGEIPVQSAALVMHEYSEVAGLSDDDAIVLQKEVIEELKHW